VQEEGCEGDDVAAPQDFDLQALRRECLINSLRLYYSPIGQEWQFQLNFQKKEYHEGISRGNAGKALTWAQRAVRSLELCGRNLNLTRPEKKHHGYPAYSN
jgi:hypothetical protein